MHILTILRRSVVFLALLTILTCTYTVIVTAAGKAMFPFQAGGSIITVNGKTYSTLQGQPFNAPRHLWGRPVSVDVSTYSANGKPLLYAGPSNKSPATSEYAENLQTRLDHVRNAHPEKVSMPVPVDLVTESASGLDPHISPAAAEYQAERLARTTDFTLDEVHRTIVMYTEGRTLGLLGEPRVNVLKVNLALDGLLPNGRAASNDSDTSSQTGARATTPVR
ncbi:MAG: potassium-transporting ATPase subunit C [Desulfovibrio sp.]|uniref:potassium-transporting ATPase subunit C n=1 Tax=Desulfovibrio sp. TaxID=885 RepID=UPI0039E39DD9